MDDVKQQDNAPQEMTLDETMEIRGAGWFSDAGAWMDGAVETASKFLKAFGSAVS
ncbi:hypothetical protein [Pseudomonas asplenii]|uniref:hypothetical protein n=1 Tax=Pseudomonas asplenii TaxID=53407 RepID=UPI00037D464F|nr:hypothetical protein [Pseudomonas fuscovaginae]